MYKTGGLKIRYAYRWRERLTEEGKLHATSFKLQVFWLQDFWEPKVRDRRIGFAVYAAIGNR
jgi:hypothetical protein